ncbi:PilT protein domain protein [Desulfonatronospira thiodismutans ASO3-1]|uniref:Ribonuclease VapC n=1 Tax=Desulfonatronospira thiodismutans ASO3-1 TaxID=555779 RepID=D6SS54_9BACT|nr:type II toxin-antitoxin system VapC family toxin [Desulfonatronospira thiodismutans]EFI33520.1 PilT protein domain protein [Desulfonatronospira thiodismutans ASO3-1]
MKRVMIDTNIYSLALKGDPEVADYLRKVDKIGISTISIGELLSGFKGGNREDKNREELDFFLDSPRVVVHAVDVETADFYASILDKLKSAGTPIPTNDMWIAASAFQHGYKLFSRDRHFEMVQGLILVAR